MNNAKKLPFGVEFDEKEGLRLDVVSMQMEKDRVERLRQEILESPLVAKVSVVYWDEVEKMGVKPK